jgi:hypothetical protein
VAAVNPLLAEYEAFRSDPVQAFRCKVRLTRAAQIRAQLRDPETLTLADFNRDIWRFEANANVGDWIDGPHRRVRASGTTGHR